jgi:tRNA 2-thiouridine synthesizing protein A
MKPGEILRILATDPAAAIDFPHYCAESGHALLSTDRQDDVLIFVIRKTHAS